MSPDRTNRTKLVALAYNLWRSVPIGSPLPEEFFRIAEELGMTEDEAQDMCGIEHLCRLAQEP
jgi:hypothetical protein